MKKIALRFLFLCAVITLGTICASTLSAQDVEELTAARTDVLSRKYLRPSRSVIFATDGSAEAERLVQIMQSASNDQFDTNHISLQRLSVTPPEWLPSLKKGREALQEEISKALEEQQVGRQIMKCWFPSFDNEQKGYSLQVLEERGAFAATDADVVEAKAGQRSLRVQLNTLGEQLIDRSYVVVYYVYLMEGDKDKMAKIEAFVYKLDFGPETMNNFYSHHFNSPQGIDQATFPLKFVYATKENLISSLFKGAVMMTFINQYTQYDLLAANLLQMADVLIASNVHDFETQATIAKTSPIAAKIGLKENLKTDDRFYVVENVLNSTTGKTKTIRRGAVRVSMHIVDNKFVADGNLEDLTHFYQYSGFGKLEEGMTLISKPDLGIGVALLLTRDPGVEVDYRVSDLVKRISWFKGRTIPGVFAFLRWALPYGDKAKDGEEGRLVVNVNGVEVEFSRISFGLRKEFNFARVVNASLEAGLGTISPNRKKNKEDDPRYLVAYSTVQSINYATLGVRLGCYVSPNFNIFAHASYDFWLSDDKTYVKDFTEKYGVKPYSFGLGLRYSF